MNNKLLISLVAVFALVGGFAVGLHAQPQPLKGGDFAGGVVPGNLFTANAGTNSVTPVLSNLLVPGAVSTGGVSANNQVTVVYTATAQFPTASAGVSLLGPVSATTSTTSTVLAFNSPGFAVGDACEVAYNGSTSTLPFGADAFVTSVSTSSNAVSATVTFWNGAATLIIGLSPTSTTGVTSTLKTTCFHTGV
jgi:hypothetical protein